MQLVQYLENRAEWGRGDDDETSGGPGAWLGWGGDR
jgi:hypothetical protein